jgi:hypothetical protein
VPRRVCDVEEEVAAAVLRRIDEEDEDERVLDDETELEEVEVEFTRAKL